MRIRDLRGEVQLMRGRRSEDGTLNPTGIVWLAVNSTLRSKRRRNSGSEGFAQGSPSGYGFYVPQPINIPFLIFDRSQDHRERQKENEGGGQNDGQRVDGYVSFCA